jgi:hypothetical protein
MRCLVHPVSLRATTDAHTAGGIRKPATGLFKYGVLKYEPGSLFVIKPPTSTAVTFTKSLEFTARESLTLTRAPGAPLLQTTSAGTVLDIALRLLAPLLLGLALLAVRGRTKR